MSRYEQLENWCSELDALEEAGEYISERELMIRDELRALWALKNAGKCIGGEGAAHEYNCPHCSAIKAYHMEQ